MHIIAAHAGEGTLVRRSLENMLVATMDLLFWDLLAKARTGLTFHDLENQVTTAEVSRLSTRHRARRRRRTR